jgi:hypothetical protein
MSKRYREVLQEVATTRTRDETARADETTRTADDARTTTAASGIATDAGRAGRATSPGGVATLVRSGPTVTTDATDPADGQGPATPARASRRPDRPGNGPPDADRPLGFAWRGRRYDVTRVLGHWREEEGWWRRPDGEPIRIEQSDLWRVEAVRVGGMAREQHGVYELSRRGEVWRLDRVWD